MKQLRQYIRNRRTIPFAWLHGLAVPPAARAKMQQYLAALACAH